MKRRRRLPKSIRLSRSRRRTWLGLLATLAAAGFVGLDRWSHRSREAAPTGDDMARYHHRTFRVVRVVDGDTIDIDCPDGAERYTRIRLWGVDTPEIAHRGQKVMHFGLEAKEFTQRRLAGRAAYLALSPKDSRDRYGRLLAYVYLDRGGEMLNKALVEQGYAYADPRFNHEWKDDFLAAEQRAQRERMGLWASVQTADMPQWRQRKKAGP